MRLGSAEKKCAGVMAYLPEAMHRLEEIMLGHGRVEGGSCARCVSWRFVRIGSG